MKESTLISVIMATYNHADFVKQAIESVLSQQGVDFEFLITDDGSVDQTRDVVAAIKDKRIQFFPNEKNRGACIVTNELIERCSGEFIALINSDDYWLGKDKLAYQVQIMRDNPNVGACFGQVRYSDKDGCDIEKSSHHHGHIFEQKNRPKSAWLRHFFDLGNCICHPTILIRKKCYEMVGMYDTRLRQLPDFDMWVRLLKVYDIYVSDRDMIAFRHLPGENASSSTPANSRRLLNEFYFILDNFFDGMSQDLLIEGFNDLLHINNPPDDLHMDIEQALLFFGENRWSSHIYNLIGLKKIHFLLGSPKHRQILINHYEIDDRVFYSMAEEAGAFDLISPTNILSRVKTLSLIAEIKQRSLKHVPSFLRPILSIILK